MFPFSVCFSSAAAGVRPPIAAPPCAVVQALRLLLLLPLSEETPEQLAGASGAGHPVQELYLSRQLVHGRFPLAEQDRFDLFRA